MAQITVFGATGKIGSRVVPRLLEAGYDVVAFVRGAHPFTPNEHLRIVEGDIYRAEQVADAIRGSDAVISTLGSWGTPKKDILTSGMRAIIPAMEQQGVRRIITLTGADARDSEDKPGLLHRLSHLLFSRIAGPILRDGEEHMRLLRASSLDFTTLRSPVMTDGGRKGTYVLRDRLPRITEQSIARDDVAAAMVELVQTGQFSRRAPVIYRR